MEALEYLYIMEKSRGPQFELQSLYEVVNKNSDELYQTLVDVGTCLNQYKRKIKEADYNVTPLVIQYMNEKHRDLWFKDQFASWDHRYSPAFAEIFTRRGMAFSFNMFNASELFNFDQ